MSAASALAAPAIESDDARAAAYLGLDLPDVLTWRLMVTPHSARAAATLTGVTKQRVDLEAIAHSLDLTITHVSTERVEGYGRDSRGVSYWCYLRCAPPPRRRSRDDIRPNPDRGRIVTDAIPQHDAPERTRKLRERAERLTLCGRGGYKVYDTVTEFDPQHPGHFRIIDYIRRRETPTRA